MTPPVADATRAFYESLLKENPASRIAINYCIEHGVLPKEEHMKLLVQYHKLQVQKHGGALKVAMKMMKRQSAAAEATDPSGFEIKRKLEESYLLTRARR